MTDKHQKWYMCRESDMKIIQAMLRAARVAPMEFLSVELPQPIIESKDYWNKENTP